MISKAEIKRVRSLHQKKFRDEQKCFIAEGPKVISDLLNSEYKAKEIYSLGKMAFPLHTPAIEVTEKELEIMSALTTPNNAIGIFEMHCPKLNLPSLKKELVLALDEIRDPGNMGTLIRIADWFGISDILCSGACVDLYNPKVVQATMGSMARVNVHYVNLQEVVSGFNNVYGTVLNGKSIYTEELSENGIILIGNESRGISETLLGLVTQKISIPNFSSGADSLNAAAAGAIICSEFRRRTG